MTVTPSSKRGTIINKDQQAVQRLSAVPIKASTTVTAGSLVYEDGSNGWLHMPTDDSIPSDRAWFAETGGIATSKGDFLIDVWKEGALVIGRADGAISVDKSCKPSTNHAGEFQANTEPTDPVSPTYGQAAQQALLDYRRRHVARYLGHVGELRGNTSRTAAADEDEDCVFLMGGEV